MDVFCIPNNMTNNFPNLGKYLCELEMMLFLQLHITINSLMLNIIFCLPHVVHNKILYLKKYLICALVHLWICCIWNMLITVYLDLSVLLTLYKQDYNFDKKSYIFVYFNLHKIVWLILISTISTMMSNYKNKPYSKCNDKFGEHEDIP
ncbi:hypothetical protein V1478_016584 [Vespula squamosa]|uniref:Uncharacterized protein n=1 Tax=Vespula squamosa TaxID=30214 RepID=A0ABD2A0Q6_VESSQ